MITTTSLASVQFKQHELTLTGPNNRGCLAVYPPGKKARQRVAAGDASGNVNVFTVGKHHDIKTDFVTGPNARPLDRLTLFEDQLFVIHGSSIGAFTKKGKSFFSFETNLTESIKVFKIHTPFIFAGGDFTFTTFRETEEVGFFMPPDRVNDMVFATRTAGGAAAKKAGDAADSAAAATTADPKLDDFDCYLACNDRVLRSVNSCKVSTEAGCEAPLTALTLAASSSKDAATKKRSDVVYGTQAGSFGAFAINANFEFVRKYSAIPSQRLPSITCLAAADVTQNGMADVISAREDGLVEVHSFSKDAMTDEPRKVWSSSVGEYVNTLATGMITNVDADEVVLHTYSGKVVSFSLAADDALAVNQQKSAVPGVLQKKPPELPSAQEQIQRNASFALAQQPSSIVTTSGSLIEDPTSGGAAFQQPSSIEITAAKVKETQEDVDRLRRQLMDRSKQYAQATGATAENTVMKAVVSEFRVRDSLTMESTSDALRLVIETDGALQYVGLRCERQLDFVPSSEESASGAGGNVLTSIAGGSGRSAPTLSSAGNAVSSPIASSAGFNSPGLNTSDGALLGEGPFYAVLRMTDQKATRVSVAFLTHEGEPTTIQATVLPRASPRTAQLRQLTIKPLCLHHRVGEGDVPAADDVPMSTIRISGSFSLKDAHAWVLKCLPGVPEMVTGPTESVTLFYRNDFHKTHMVVKYAKKDLECRSENLSALAVFKDHVTREATLRKIPVRIQAEPMEEGVVRHLKLLDPLLAHQIKIAHRVKLLAALKEIDAMSSGNGGGALQGSSSAATMGGDGDAGGASSSSTFATEEYKEILASAMTLQQDEKQGPQRIDYLRKVYHKLFADRAGFYGKGVTERLHRQLSQLLEEYSLPAMLDFFQREK